MQNQTAPIPHGVSESFYSKFGKYVTAVLSGFDRVRFRATLRVRLVGMGRVPLHSYRLSCRISKKSGEVLDTVLDRVDAPIGQVLSRLILKTPPEQWETIKKSFPPKSGRNLTLKEQKRRRAERAIREGLSEPEPRVLSEVSTRAIHGGPGTPKPRY
jgi:hypothetical protein